MTDATRQQILEVGAQAMAEARRLWSVTTLIKAGTGAGEGLVSWAAKMSSYRAYDEFEHLAIYREKGQRAEALKWLTGARFDRSGQAKERGTAIHAIVEDFAYGRTPQYEPEFQPYVDNVERFLNDWQPTFQAAEAPVYNLTHSYAGTMDLILDIEGVRCIVDAKTTDKDPDDPEVKSLPPYREVALQLCAYARAEIIGTSPATMRTFNRRRYYVYDPALTYEPMIAVEGALALVIAPTFYRLVPVAIDDRVWHAFGHCREMARWNLEVGPTVLGPDLIPPEGDQVGPDGPEP